MALPHCPVAARCYKVSVTLGLRRTDIGEFREREWGGWETSVISSLQDFFFFFLFFLFSSTHLGIIGACHQQFFVFVLSFFFLILNFRGSVSTNKEAFFIMIISSSIPNCIRSLCILLKNEVMLIKNFLANKLE